MSSTQQLWAPLSIKVEHSARLSQKQAVEYLESFLSAPGGGLSDQNTIASLLRLQTGLRDELERPSSSASGDSKKAKSLKRKHDKVGEQAATTAEDGTVANAEDDVVATAAGSDEPKTKKKRKQKKSIKPEDE